MNRNLVTPIVLMIMAAAAITTGCAEDTFVASDPVLNIKAYTEDGATYLEVDDENLVINLGEVPVYGSKTATFQLHNPTTQTLTIQTLDYVEEDTTGQLWGDVTWRHDTEDVIPKLPPLNIPGGAKRLIDVPFAPLEEGNAQGVIKIVSNAGNGREKTVTVKANGVYFGQPDIEIEYNGLTGPTAEAPFPIVLTACTAPCQRHSSLETLVSTLKPLRASPFRNTAMCEPYPGGDACMSCALTINNGDSAFDIGLGFKEGTNDEGRFAFAGSTATPFSVPQQDVDCGNSG